MKIYQEFKDFAIKGNAVELAVGIVIGAAFTQVVNSLVNDILNPILGFLTGGVDLSGLKLDFFHHAIRFGLFLNAVINFVIVSFVIFLIVKQINRFRANRLPLEKECPFCSRQIPLRATRCPNCTSDLAK